MVPSHALRFQSMLRAMLEIVIPAIDPSQKLAIDQATIVAGNLRLLLSQAGHTADYQRVELREYRQLGLALCRLLAGTEPASRHGALFQAVEPAEEAAMDAGLLQTKQAVDELLKAALSSEDARRRSAAAKLVLEQSEAQVLRERAWFAAAGFELDRSALPTIAEVLSR